MNFYFPSTLQSCWSVFVSIFLIHNHKGIITNWLKISHICIALEHINRLIVTHMDLEELIPLFPIKKKNDSLSIFSLFKHSILSIYCLSLSLFLQYVCVAKIINCTLYGVLWSCFKMWLLFVKVKMFQIIISVSRFLTSVPQYAKEAISNVYRIMNIKYPTCTLLYKLKSYRRSKRHWLPKMRVLHGLQERYLILHFDLSHINNLQNSEKSLGLQKGMIPEEFSRTRQI